MVYILESISLSIENEDNENYLLLFRGHNTWELNIKINKKEIKLLENIKETSWKDNKIMAGLSFITNGNVFWVYNGDETVSIMVGNDRTWDFSVIVPLNIIEKIYLEAV
jgi:hypothetical protein